MEKKFTNTELKLVFSHLKYVELLPLRLVSKQFNMIIQEILNNALFEMNDRFTNRLEEVSLELKYHNVNQNVLRYFKITNYLRSELNVIITLTYSYMKDGFYSFGGACVLEFFSKFLSLSYKDIENNFEYITIYHMIETFLNNFDEKVEPNIIQNNTKFKNPWFGLKLINLLDCSLDLNYKIEVGSVHNNNVILEGKYNGEETHIVDSVPIKKEIKTDEEKRAFLQNLRNNIRWNNLLYCIERSTGELSQNCLQPGLYTQFKNSSIYEKKPFSKRSLLGDKLGISYKVNLKCGIGFLPLRASTIFAQSNDSITTIQRGFNLRVSEGKENEEQFDLNLTMKAKSRDEDEIVEKIVKIISIGNTCVITENLKRINSIEF